MKADYNQALLDKAQAYIEQPLTARRYDGGLTEISQLYADITGEPVGKCRQCQYLDYLAVVTAYIREATRFLHPELMADSKYTFAPGFQNEVIADGRYSKVVKAENLDDKDAEALIKLGYGHVIVKKSSKEADATDADDTTEVSDSEKKAKEAEGKAKDALKTEKEAHAATKKELTATKSDLAKVQKELDKLKSTPAAPAPTMTASSNSPAPEAPAVPAAPADGTQA